MQNHDTGEFMKKLWIHMCVDANNATGGITHNAHLSALKAGNVALFRSLSFPGRFGLSPNNFKWEYQLETLFKRFRFKDDVYTQDELELKTVKAFIKTQERLCTIRNSHTVTTHMIIQNARKIVKSILGIYDPCVHQSLCRFGVNAAVGVPFSKSYLDERLTLPISGSSDHVSWFTTKVLNNYQSLRDCIYECQNKRPRYATCEALHLTCVPKSYKSLRGIMPNTQIGGFYSNGLGDYITQRLLDAGLNISKLQMKH